MGPNGATAHTTVGYMKSERGALGIEEQRTQALRAVVDGEEEVAGHAVHGGTGRDAAHTAGMVVIGQWLGRGRAWGSLTWVCMSGAQTLTGLNSQRRPLDAPVRRRKAGHAACPHSVD